MVVPLKEKEIELTPEQQERMYWEQLKFESHKWIEYVKGYYKCDYCGITHTSVTSIDNHSICRKNPYIPIK